MRILAVWPEGSEMTSLIGYSKIDDGRCRLGFHLGKLSLVAVFPYRYPDCPWQLSYRFSVYWYPKNLWLFGAPLYFDYTRQSLIVGDRRISLEYLELLAKNYGEKVNR
jgi:hypothetical protein